MTDLGQFKGILNEINICSQKFKKRFLSRYKGDILYYCVAMDNNIVIDAHKTAAEYRFVNHSCVLNSEMLKCMSMDSQGWL